MEMKLQKRSGVPATSWDTKEIDEILDSHVGRSRRNKTYEEYLVK